MRHFTLIAAFLALAACAPGGVTSAPGGGSDAFSDGAATPPSTTGFTNEHGVAFITNGNPRVAEALKKGDPSLQVPKAPAAPKAPTVTAAAPAPALRTRLLDVKISRYNQDPKAIQRYGKTRADIKVFFNDQDPVTFSAEFKADGGRLHFEKVLNRYTLTGDIDDLPTTNEANGDFLLTDAQTGGSARIFYDAYKAKIDLTLNLDPAKQPTQGSRAARSAEFLKNPNNFWWVHDWIVLGGVSTYNVDIVEYHQGPQVTAPHNVALAISGKSLETGSQALDDPDYAAQIQTVAADDKPCDNVVLRSNSKEGPRRTFACQIDDPSTKARTEFVIDVDSVNAKSQFIDDSNGQDLGPDADLIVSGDKADPTLAQDAPVPAQPTVKPHPPTAPPVAQPKAPAPIVGQSFLPLHSSPRAGKMNSDFAANRSLRKVVNWIATYKTSLRPRLTSYFYYATPFRQMLDEIGKMLDVSPVFAYLQVREGPNYFVNTKEHGVYYGKITNYNDHPPAFGPFQMHWDAAQTAEMSFSKSGEDNNDERWYFAPAACGAAKILAKASDNFKTDMTLGIMAYNRGPKGAMNLAKEYGYTFVRMSGRGTMPDRYEQYVDDILALYFIAANPTEFGFDTTRSPYTGLPNPEKLPLPSHYVMPPHAVNAPDCAALFKRLGL